jgi:hypothetical protein
VEFWKGLANAPPQWLYSDSKVTTCPELSQLNRQGVWFATIRRRGSAVVRRPRQMPASAWSTAVIDTPKRFHRGIRYIDERVHLGGYAGPVRQVAVGGPGKEQPTLLLTNDLEETARNLVIRYAGRNRVEDGPGSAVNSFHLNCLSSEVRLNVDVDATMTVLANGCYRWLASRLKGWERSRPKDPYRKFVETAGLVEVKEDRVVVRLDRRSHNPILREAHLDWDATPVPWLGNRPVQFTFA